jgi:hypothetical protein
VLLLLLLLRRVSVDRRGPAVDCSLSYACSALRHTIRQPAVLLI